MCVGGGALLYIFKVICNFENNLFKEECRLIMTLV